MYSSACKLSVDGSLAASGITVFSPTYRERQVQSAAEKKTHTSTTDPQGRVE